MFEKTLIKAGDDEQFSVYEIREINHPKTERDLNQEVFVDGLALAGFITELLKIRERQGAHEVVNAIDKSIQNDDFRMEVVETGFSEVGGLLISKHQVSGSISIDEIRMLDSSGKSVTWIEMSSNDIQKAMKVGKVDGWIHSQPGGTAPSVNFRGDPSDAAVSKMVANLASCPSHVALILDRYGKKITAYLYNLQANPAKGEKFFTRLKGLKIRIPSDIDRKSREHLMNLQYTDV